MQKTLLIGYLGKDTEMKYTPRWHSRRHLHHRQHRNGLVRLSLRSTIHNDSAGRVEARPLCQKPPSFWRLQGRPVWVPSSESFSDGAAKRSRDSRSGLTSLPSAVCVE